MKPVKVDKWCKTFGEQNFRDGKKLWSVARLIDLSKDLEQFEIPMAGLNLCQLFPKNISTAREFIAHVKQILDADLSYPIILDDEGFVMDGRHRVLKALLEEKEAILAVRFDETPSPDHTEDE
jgi:hypothetical protein